MNAAGRQSGVIACLNPQTEIDRPEARPRDVGQAYQPAGSGGLPAACSTAKKVSASRPRDTGLVSPVNRQAVSLPYISGGSHFGIRAETIH